MIAFLNHATEVYAIRGQSSLSQLLSMTAFFNQATKVYAIRGQNPCSKLLSMIAFVSPATRVYAIRGSINHACNCLWGQSALDTCMKPHFWQGPDMIMYAPFFWPGAQLSMHAIAFGGKAPLKHMHETAFWARPQHDYVCTLLLARGPIKYACNCVWWQSILKHS